MAGAGDAGGRAADGGLELGPIPPSTVWTLVLVTGVLTLVGLLLSVVSRGHPVAGGLFLVSGLAFVASLVAGATLGDELPDNTRVGMGLTAGLAAIGWALAVWYGAAASQAAAWTCGTAIALPSIGALWGAMGVKGFLLQLWGIEDPVGPAAAQGRDGPPGPDAPTRAPPPVSPRPS